MKKSLAGLCAAIVALALIVWIPRVRESARLRAGYIFDTARAEDVLDLRVRYRGDAVRLVHRGPRWFTAQDDFPVDPLMIRKALGYLLSIRAYETVSDSVPESGLTDYGLDAASARRVQWKWKSGQEVDLLLGKTSAADYGYVYWKWRDAPAVYRTPGNFIWEISPRAPAWKSRSLWPAFSPEDVLSLEVEWRNGADGVVAYKLERGRGAGFEVGSPPDSGSFPAETRAAERLFEQASRFTIDDFGLELDPHSKDVSMENPAMVIRIALTDGTVRTLKAGKVFEGYQYTEHPYHENRVWVFKWRYDDFKKFPADLRAGKAKERA